MGICPLHCALLLVAQVSNGTITSIPLQITPKNQIRRFRLSCTQLYYKKFLLMKKDLFRSATMDRGERDLTINGDKLLLWFCHKLGFANTDSYGYLTFLLPTETKLQRDRISQIKQHLQPTAFWHGGKTQRTIHLLKIANRFNHFLKKNKHQDAPDHK